MKTQSVWTRIQMFPIYLCVLLALCTPVAASASGDAWGRSDISTYDAVSTVVIHGMHWVGEQAASGVAALIAWWERG